MRVIRPSVSILVSILALLLLASPTFAYIVFLKDGTQVSTKEKYRVEGDRAVLVLRSGTETFIALSEIDIAKTEEINKIDFGTAKLIEGGDVKELATETRFENETETLSDALARNRREARAKAPAAAAGAAKPAEAFVPITQAGYVDLLSLMGKPYTQGEVKDELLRSLAGQGLEKVAVFAGSQGDHLLLQITTSSEAAVFKAMKDAATAFVQVHDRFPQQVAAFELLLLNEDGVRAGQFLLTPDLANALVSGSMEPSSFYLRYVEF